MLCSPGCPQTCHPFLRLSPEWCNYRYVSSHSVQEIDFHFKNVGFMCINILPVCICATYPGELEELEVQMIVSHRVDARS